MEGSAIPRTGATEPDCGVLIADLQQQVRELSARFANIEFEKAERNHLGAELKNLESQLQGKLERMAAQLERLAQRFDGTPGPVSEQEPGGHLPAVLKRMDLIESKTEELDGLSIRVRELEENNRANSTLLLELRNLYAGIRREIAEVKSQIELVRQDREAEEPSTPLEVDVRAIRKNLDELRHILTAAGGNRQEHPLPKR